jgi:hypothetical protein
MTVILIIILLILVFGQEHKLLYSIIVIAFAIILCTVTAFAIILCTIEKKMIFGGNEKQLETKMLYHGSPHLLDELIPMTPRGSDDFNSQTGIYATPSKTSAKLYAIARDKERLNKGFGIKNDILYLRKDRWLEEFNEGKPLHKLNDLGYLYTIKSNKHEQNPNIPSEYVIKHKVKPISREVITPNDIVKNIKYVTKEEMNKIFEEKK